MEMIGKKWLAVIAICSLGCGSNDSNWAHHKTVYQLDILRQVLMKWPPSRAVTYKSVDELISAAISSGYLFDDSFNKDGWGRPLQLDRQEGAIRLISAGPNGNMENGQGDDVSVEVRFTRDSTGTMRWNAEEGK